MEKLQKEFDPNEYKSFEELPRGHKRKFEAIEDGKGFVLKSVEKNPETAHRLALAEDQAINTLKQAIETHNLTFDDLLSQYRTAAEQYNFEEKRQASELLKQISDRDILRGGNYDNRLKKEFRKRYESLTYSQKTQDVLIENIDSSDLEVIAKLLLDEKFSRKIELLEKTSDSDESIKKLYELTSGDLGVVKLLVGVSNPARKVEMLKDISESINIIRNEEQKEKKLKDRSFNSIKQEVGETLAKNADYSEILQLIDDKFLETRNLKRVVHEVESDQFLYDLASRSNNIKEITYLFKFIADKEFFSKIVDEKGKSFSKLSDTEKQGVIDLAKKLSSVLENKPEIYQEGYLQESNKFIIGVPDDENKLFIAWSNTNQHEYHKDIFKTMAEQTGKRFPEDLRSGGWVELNKKNDNQISVVFSRSSGDFGNYGHRVLEKFREAILKTLYEKLGHENIEFKIDVSS